MFSRYFPVVPPGTRSHHFPELDGLRFFAFLLVYLTHTIGEASVTEHHHLSPWVGQLVATLGKAGNFGVDLFFVLSSFLITTLLLVERQALGQVDVGKFYLRRILRIWPLYFVVIGVALLFTLFAPDQEISGRHLAGLLLFAGNWTWMAHPTTTVAGPLWSLSVEEQFYLIWPWLVAFRPHRIIPVALAVLVLGMLSCCLAQYWAPEHDWVTRNSLIRGDGFAVGSLIAVALRAHRVRLPEPVRCLILFVAFLMFGWVAAEFQLVERPVPTLNLLLGWPLVALASGAILIATIGCQGSLRRVLANPVLTYLGRISFGLYLWHVVVLTLLDLWILPAGHGPLLMVLRWVLGLCLTVMLAAASFHGFERRFLRLKERRFTVLA